MDKEYIEKLNKEINNMNAYVDWATEGEEDFKFRIIQLTFELLQKEEAKRQSLVDALKDLIDLTKGIDENGDIYNAQQIDYEDIENILNRRNITFI